MRHIKIFRNHTEYEQYISACGSTMCMPNFAICEEEAEVHYNNNGTLTCPFYGDDTYTLHFIKVSFQDFPMPDDVVFTDPTELKTFVFPYPSTSGEGYYYQFNAGNVNYTTYYPVDYGPISQPTHPMDYDSGYLFTQTINRNLYDEEYNSVENYLRENKTLNIYIYYREPGPAVL